MSGVRTPPDAKPSVSGDEAFDRAVRDAQADIASSVEKAGLRNDPLRYPLAATSTLIGLFPGFLLAMREAGHEARQPLDAAAIERLGKAAAKGASRASAELARAHYMRSVWVGSLVVAAVVAAGVAGGFAWGRSEAMTRFRMADRGFAAMIHDSPAAGVGWLNLARLNDYEAMIAACQASRGFTDASGRHACLAPLWLDDGAPAALPTPVAPGGKAPPT